MSEEVFKIKKEWNCKACEDGQLENVCQECCPHWEHHHYMCVDCGLQMDPTDYYNEDEGQDR